MRRAAIIVLGLVVGLQLVMGSASAACTKPHKHPIGNGPIPSGGAWSVTATIKNNGSCKSWLFGIDFDLGEFGNAGTGTGIPPGGHVPREYFTLSASVVPNMAGTEDVLYGYTGIEGARLVATTKDGGRFTVIPQLVPEPLRAKVDWLRPFRFFVYFFPAESPIEQISVFTSGGRLVYRTKSYHGEFF